MNSLIKKIIIIASVFAICAIVYGIEYGVSKTYDFEIYSISLNADTIEMNDAIAEETNYITVRVTKGGKPINNQQIFCYSKTTGVERKDYRKYTNEDGLATFRIIPPKGNFYNPLTDITLEFLNESNSKIIEVNAKKLLVIPVIEVEESSLLANAKDFASMSSGLQSLDFGKVV